jgi:pimeloyl-ACP methyl ester carboxylesterase
MHAVGVDDVVRVLAAVLQRHGINQAHLIGHSFGTFVVAHMRKLFPETVLSVLLCDPVCMLTCFPKLLYNFIYRGVSFRELLDDPVEMARWLVARDLCIASTFCRHFFWCDA